jgi:hypothetical protein
MSRKGFGFRPEFAVMGPVIKAEDLLNISHILCCCTAAQSIVLAVTSIQEKPAQLVREQNAT